MILKKHLTSAELRLYTDASMLGMGAVMGKSWFMEKWPEQFKKFHINILELFAIATALVTWGDKYRNLDLVVFTDNKPVTQIWLSGSTKNKQMMKIIRFLFFFLAKRK